MSRAWPVVKREFLEMVRTKPYIIGTVLGPVLIVVLMALPLLFLSSGGDEVREMVVLDASGAGVGEQIAAALSATGSAAAENAMAARFSAESRVVEPPAEAERREMRQRITAEEIEGYLYLPPGILEGEEALYEGRNATSMTQMGQLESLVTSAVRTHRMQVAGVPPQVMAEVLRPVSIEKRKPGTEGEAGAGAEASFGLGYLMAMTVYLGVILFAASVMRGVLEEKKDRIVEVLLSSVDARQFIIGKVMGIGLASLLQMLVWVVFAAIAIAYAPELMERAGVEGFEMPTIPGTIAVVFLFFFTTGFLLYAAMFAAAGAIATSDQEANQLQFPVTIPLLIGFFMTYAVMADADSTTAVAGTLIPFTAPMVVPFRAMMTDIPFTAPMVVPFRAMMTDIPLTQYIVAGVLMIATLLGVMWAAAKIYRIGVLSTGKRPSMQELVRWLRTA